MAIQIDDPMEWAANMPPEIQEQIFGQLGDDAGGGNGNSVPSMLQWGGLTPDDIGQVDSFDVGDAVELAVDALGSISANGSAMSNIGNLMNWGIRQLPNIVTVGELRGGFGAESIGSPLGDLAGTDTMMTDDFLGLGFDPFGM